MNYQKIYDNLIYSAAEHPKLDDYKELHHIIPKCLGGTNEKSNLILLTARQHYLAHWLLYKIHKTTKLVHAWHAMSRVGIGQTNRTINSHLFEYAKKERNRLLSENSKGENNWFYGKTHSKESIEKAMKTRSETYANDPEKYDQIKLAQALRMSKKWKGVPKTKESNEKRGRPGLIMLRNIQSGECIRIPKHESHLYDTDIWKGMFYGTPHSGLGSRWTTNGVDNIKIKKDQELPDGFYYGRTNKRNQK